MRITPNRTTYLATGGYSWSREIEQRPGCRCYRSDNIPVLAAPRQHAACSAAYSSSTTLLPERRVVWEKPSPKAGGNHHGYPPQQHFPGVQRLRTTAFESKVLARQSLCAARRSKSAGSCHGMPKPASIHPPKTRANLPSHDALPDSPAPLPPGSRP